MNGETRALVEAGAGLIAAAQSGLQRRTWGDDENGTCCILSALVPGAASLEECERSGWPRWFAAVCMALYDSDSGATDELAAATAWAERVEQAISVPLSYERAEVLFHQALLAAVHAGGPAEDWEPERRIAFSRLREAVATAEVAGAVTAAAAALGVAAAEWQEGWGRARAAQREQLIEALEAAAAAAASAEHSGPLVAEGAELRLYGPPGPELNELQRALTVAGARVDTICDEELRVEGSFFTIRGYANITLFFQPPAGNGPAAG